MELIPTRYKYKISKDFSFPVGAKLISEALQNADHYSSLSLSFRDHPTIFKSDFQNLIKSSGRIPVLRASFEHRAKGMNADNLSLEMGFYNENWKITVYPVPRTIKHVVQQEIIDKGLPLVRSWLAKKPASCFRGRKSYTLLFDLKTSELVSETENHLS